MPEDAVRVSSVIYLTGTNIWRPLTEVGDENTWRMMNQTVQTSATPTHFFVKGFDEIGIYPIPSTAVTDGIELVFEPKHRLITADDYTTGTVSLTNGSNVITGNATVFTNQMADGTYVLQVTDGSDGNYYKITGYSSATSLTMENYYQGITNATAAYRIGQVSKIPEEYQEAPIDYAMFRHFLEKGETDMATKFQALWETSLEDAENVYGNSTGNQIIAASGSTHSFNPLTDITMNQIKV